MKRIFLSLAMTLIAATFVFGQSKDEQEIRQTLEKLADAITRRDADAAANYWADNWTIIGRNGATTTKAQRLAGMKSGQPRLGTFKYEDINIRMLGNTAAVVTARPTYPIKFSSGEVVTVGDRATMVLSKNNGRWQIVATQTTWDNPETGDNAAVEKQLGEIMTNWGSAAGRRDVAALEKILVEPDFIVKSADGKIQTRAQYLEAVKNLPGDAIVTGSASKTVVEGETAVSMGTYSVTPKAGGQPMNYIYTATFIRRAGRWMPMSFYGVREQK